MVGRGSKIENLSTEFMDGPNTNNTHQSIIVIEYSMASRRPVLNKTLGLFLISFAYKVIANRRLDFVRFCPDRLKAIVYLVQGAD